MKRYNREILSVVMTYRKNRGRGSVSSNDFVKNTEIGFVSTNNLQKTRGEGGRETERENNERLQQRERSERKKCFVTYDFQETY